MKYTIQRPLTVWVEVVVDEADNLEEALEKADEMFKDGDYIELDGTFDINYDKYWSQDELGKVAYV
jgi:PII-like signaling protein